MKIISYPPDPAVEDARFFTEAVFNHVNWDYFRAEIHVLEACEMLPVDVVRDVHDTLYVTMRRLSRGMRLSLVECLQAARVLEAICDVVDGIDIANGPEYLEFVENVYWEQNTYDPALEVSRSTKIINLDGHDCVLHVWESNAPEEQERFIRGCEGIIIVFSITSRKSFERVKAFYDYTRSIREGNHVPIYLIGSKRDLEARRQVATMEAVVMAAKLRLGEPFREVSARTGENIDEVFWSVVREIRRSQAETGTKRIFKSIKQFFGSI